MFKSKIEKIRLKIFDLVDGAVNPPFSFTRKPNVSIVNNFSSNDILDYTLHYKCEIINDNEVHDIFLNISVISSISITLSVKKDSFICLGTDITSFLNSIIEYFKSNTKKEIIAICHVLLDNGENVILKLNEIDNAEKLINRTIKIVIIQKEWLSSKTKQEILELFGMMATYDKYKFQKVYDDILILSDENISAESIETIVELYNNESFTYIETLKTQLYNSGFELLEMFI